MKLTFSTQTVTIPPAVLTSLYIHVSHTLLIITSDCVDNESWWHYCRTEFSLCAVRIIDSERIRELHFLFKVWSIEVLKSECSCRALWCLKALPCLQLVKRFSTSLSQHDSVINKGLRGSEKKKGLLSLKGTWQPNIMFVMWNVKPQDFWSHEQTKPKWKYEGVI